MPQSDAGACIPPIRCLFAIRARPAQEIAVIGAGTIGPDIAYYLKSAIPNLDAAPRRCRATGARQRDAAYARLRRQGCPAQAHDAGRGRGDRRRLHPNSRLRRDRRADWVIEAATEDLGAQAQDLRAGRGHRPAACADHLQHQFAAGRADLRRSGAQRAGDGHSLFRAGLAQSDCRGDPLVRRRSRRCRTSELAVLSDRQGSAGHRRCSLFHARPHLRQLVQRGSLAARPRQRRRDRQRRRRVRACRAVLRVNMAHGNPIIIETNTLQADEEGEHYRPAPIFRSVENGLRWRRAGRWR